MLELLILQFADFLSLFVSSSVQADPRNVGELLLKQTPDAQLRNLPSKILSEGRRLGINPEQPWHPSSADYQDGLHQLADEQLLM